MNTFLFDDVVFGPVLSRRLGVSLGINLLPVKRKYCNFDCIYCECGLNDEGNGLKVVLPTRTEVYTKLGAVLHSMVENNQRLDFITFAGNGEPTMHPEFAGIVEDTLALRDLVFKEVKISVLSNATMLGKKSVVDALKIVDQNILKLDSGIVETIALINRPIGVFRLDELIGQLRQFSGKMILQTMFLRGKIGEKVIDNTTGRELDAWVSLVAAVRPQKVMIYTIDRNTPFDTLEKVPLPELQAISARIVKLGIPVQVAG